MILRASTWSGRAALLVLVAALAGCGQLTGDAPGSARTAIDQAGDRTATAPPGARTADPTVSPIASPTVSPTATRSPTATPTGSATFSPSAPSGDGELTVHLTAPVTLDASVSTDVACSTGAVRYQAEVASASVGEGYALGATVTVAGYRGPGDYQGAIVVTLTSPEQTLPVPLTAPVQVTEAGGSAAVAAPEGQVAGTIAWTCG
ncbi:hypothetical protein OEB99_00330 [Actinotalea sp. M2MS4P-6]|uniref:hypothetical protein n=1 Tax=Actinotalea sp. M2MS4P-6 TaxID=2983762 RepID=UPI0021E501E1|nr:hypothetical protein [Actinotalea sp. M2MS4P-6]MCV2392744.1 hypothetical protein [Actinotalea sp. M2MS4P-6]